MARPARFERATAWFVARYSIQLSYRRGRAATIGNKPFQVKGLYSSGTGMEWSRVGADRP